MSFNLSSRWRLLLLKCGRKFTDRQNAVASKYARSDKLLGSLSNKNETENDTMLNGLARCTISLSQAKILVVQTIIAPLGRSVHDSGFCGVADELSRG